MDMDSAQYEEVIARFGEAAETGLREQVSRALFNKGFILGALDRPEEAIAMYEEVAARFGESAETGLREQVAWALVSKGFILGALDRPEEAIAMYEEVIARFGEVGEVELREPIVAALCRKGAAFHGLKRLDESEAAFRSAISYDSLHSRAHNSLGNLLLDFVGDADQALIAFEHGLQEVGESEDRAMPSANAAYALALKGGGERDVHAHLTNALGNGASDQWTKSGRRLLEALRARNEDRARNWQVVFDRMGDALASEDSALWSDYIDDLQRLTWLILAHGQGVLFEAWMEKEQISARYAPYYQAVVAAIEGEHHLSSINAETREPARDIYVGITRLLELYGREVRSAPTRKVTARGVAPRDE